MQKNSDPTTYSLYRYGIVYDLRTILSSTAGAATSNALGLLEHRLVYELGLSDLR